MKPKYKFQNSTDPDGNLTSIPLIASHRTPSIRRPPIFRTSQRLHMDHTVSERFCPPDSDITFLSSDGVLFKVHRKNIDTHADGFAPVGIATPSFGETVDLSESSQVLEILFGYVYPQRQPDLGKVDFSILDQLSEAAEKYQVYSALESCKFHMQAAASKHALEVLNYAIKHGYPDVADIAAPNTISIPLKDICARMSPASLGAWIQYYDKWVELLVTAHTTTWTTPHHCNARSSCVWFSTQTLITQRLGSRPGSLCDLISLFPQTTTNLCCIQSVDVLRTNMIAQRVQRIPKFSQFL